MTVLKALAKARGPMSLKEIGAACAMTPDLIIADCHLDQGTGTEAIAALRQAVGHAIPAIAVTADHTAKVQAQIQRLGISYLRKPIKTNELFALIHKVIAP